MFFRFLLGAGLALVLLTSCMSASMYTSRVEARYPPLGDFMPYENGELHVISRGEGAPVLMIHGASANLRWNRKKKKIKKRIRKKEEQKQSKAPKE